MSGFNRLKKIKRESMFTEALEFKVFVEELCNRYAKVYGEILPKNDYNYIADKLEAKGII